MKRIGILTYFASINYGAFLQAFALRESLEKRYGQIAKIEIINYDSEIAHERYLDNTITANVYINEKRSRQYRAFIQSREKLRLPKDKMVSDNISEIQQFLCGKYDIIIVGSDEVWRADSFRGFPNAYWLNFDLDKTVYMAYAVSGRSPYRELPRDKRMYICNALKRFVYIGTRDEVTRRELLKLDSKKIINRNCDPCFLMPQLFKVSNEEKRSIREKYHIRNSQPMISIMMKNMDVVNRLYRMMKYDNQVICLYNVNENMKENNPTEASPIEWSQLIAASDLVITDYFHGTVFSILHGVPFISMEGEEPGRGKIENLLLENDMRDRFVYQSYYIGNNRALAIDLYTMGRKAVREYESSLIRKAMEKEFRKSTSFFEMLDGIIQ